MTTEEFENRVMRLQRRGIMTRHTAAEMINSYAENETERENNASRLEKIERLNDEDAEFFIKLNQLINEIIYS